MPQHDYVIDNQGFPQFRGDLNNALAAIFSNNSGGSAPANAPIGAIWADTTNKRLKVKNSGGNWTDLSDYDQGFGGYKLAAGVPGRFTMQNGLWVQWSHSGNLPYENANPNSSGNFQANWRNPFGQIFFAIGVQHTGLSSKMFSGLSSWDINKAVWTVGYEDPRPSSLGWTISFSVLGIGTAGGTET